MRNVTYLTDTQIAIWWEADQQRLPERARAVLADPAHNLAFSIVVLWETVIKAPRGRPDFRVDAKALRAALCDDDMTELGITADHVLAVGALPPVHRDPFDRLMVAQARCDGRRFLTADRALAGYGAWVEIV